MREVVALESIGSLTEAVALTIDGSGIARKVMADRLGVELRHFNRMRNGEDSRHFPRDLIEAVMEECGSVLPLEWLAWRRGYALHEKSLGSVLTAIRDALLADGKEAKFSIHENGRIEPAGRLA